MKVIIFFVAVLSFTSASSVIEDAVCGIWSGWGHGMTGEKCADTIDTSCRIGFKVFPALIEFFETFDVNKLIEIAMDLYQFIYGVFNQFKDCSYIENFGKFFKNFINFINNIDENLDYIFKNFRGFIRCLQEARYFDAGVFIGNVFRIIIGE